MPARIEGAGAVAPACEGGAPCSAWLGCGPGHGAPRQDARRCALFESERFFSDLYCLAPGQTPARPQSRRSDKVYYVAERPRTIQVGDEVEDVEPGVAVLGSAVRTPTAWDNRSGSPGHAAGLRWRRKPEHA